MRNPFEDNGLSAGAHIFLPSLAVLNSLRAELGEPALSRDEVPDNIHFANELSDEDIA